MKKLLCITILGLLSASAYSDEVFEGVGKTHHYKGVFLKSCQSSKEMSIDDGVLQCKAAGYKRCDVVTAW